MRSHIEKFTRIIGAFDGPERTFDLEGCSLVKIKARTDNLTSEARVVYAIHPFGEAELLATGIPCDEVEEAVEQLKEQICAEDAQYLSADQTVALFHSILEGVHNQEEAFDAEITVTVEPAKQGLAVELDEDKCSFDDFIAAMSESAENLEQHDDPIVGMLQNLSKVDGVELTITPIYDEEDEFVS